MIDIKQQLNQRILVLDGAMGTMIQRYELSEAEYRGERFAHLPGIQRGNNDLLVLSRPELIREIHAAYLSVGADILETNTFNANSVSMEEYGLQAYVSEINFEAARIAREEADRFTNQEPTKPRFVAGAVGPTNKTLSMSPDVDRPAYRAISFDQLKESYLQQMVALIEGGVDLFLIETIFDTLNAKAALLAAQEAMAQTGRQLPIMLSLTLADSGGRTLSGQTIEAFIASIMHANLLSIGLNCSFGAREMKPFLKRMGEIAPYYISAYPNAGLPNRFGEYDETPEKMAEQVKEYIDEGLVNIIGGCCGTTPQHIAQYQALLRNAQPHTVASANPYGLLSGLELLETRPENNFINVGERCNVAGSRKFLRLIKERNYEEALGLARQQVEDGAQIIDINMDDAMLDAAQEMETFLHLIAGEPEICKVPIMIDSSKFEVIEAGLKCLQGKSVVNSISLKEGEANFLTQARSIHSMGAAVVVMAFDEKGQADTYARRIEICERAYRLLVDQVQFNPNDIIFDPNVLAIATGIKEHDNYAVDFIAATRWITTHLQGAKVSGGISNLSFSFRGNNYLREAMHAVFLYYAIKEGMSMGIVNPATAVTYTDIPADMLELIEDVILNRRADATERLVEAADLLKDQDANVVAKTDEREGQTVNQRLEHALVKGRPDHLEADLAEALLTSPKAVDIIDGPLMSGMNQVGELFGAGKMFLPQVVKTARTMKRAVEILQPVIEAQKNENVESTNAGKYLLATVKGDVHDIGKNIVGVILACNNFQVIDLGVMVPAEEIVKQAIEQRVDFVGLSGLITPSLEEMCRVAAQMEAAGLTIPLMIGGATTSALHTAVKVAPCYSGPVFHVKDAARNPILSAQLMNGATRQGVIDKLRAEQQVLRDTLQVKTESYSYAEASARSLRLDWDEYQIPVPKRLGIHQLNSIRIADLRPFINWRSFFNAWKIGGSYADISGLSECGSCRTSWLASFPEENRSKAAEAMQLFKEANRMLTRLEEDIEIHLSASFGLFVADTHDQQLRIHHHGAIMAIPCLRQQQKQAGKSHYLSLTDFIAPSTVSHTDYIGAFVVTVGSDFADLITAYKAEGDDYKTLLLQTLGDRLVEAASEWLHLQVRTQYWGYSPDEQLTELEMLKGHYRGIRPAIGYPSLPDQTLNFELARLLNFEAVGVTLTEHGAMSPTASVSGLYFAHPQATYFMVGEIDDLQRQAYAKARKMDLETLNQYVR